MIFFSKSKAIAFCLFVMAFFFVISCKINKAIEAEEEAIVVVNNTPKVYEIDSSAPIWADEFEKEGSPDPNKWSYDIGGNGWGNNELQYYSNSIENAEVKSGFLKINAIRKQNGGNKYASARLVSKNKGDFLYGRIEVKAKLPKGIGTWPAIWMLPTTQNYGSQYWPDNGEIDIMEHVGFDQNVVHGNIHTKAFNHSIGTNKGNHINVNDASEKFNLYAINWYPDSLVFEINGSKYFEFKKLPNYGWQEWPFDRKFHLLMNIAVGGNWGGQKGVDETVFPQTMEIDYVRVFGLKEKK